MKTGIESLAAAADLGVDRMSPGEYSAIGEADLRALGGLVYGAHGNAGQPLAGPGWLPFPVSLSVLSPAEPVLDLWRSACGPQQAGRCGAVRWRADGRWLFGELQLDDDGSTTDLEQLAERAYADVFATLAASGYPHLLRVWNYMPAINAHCDGVERYRQFNAGRQQAFLRAAQSAFEGAPAASALGSHHGPLSLSFLAGKQPALALENPRQVSAYRYPDNYGARSPSFSRAALIDAGGGRVGLLISGTSSIVGHETRHAGDVIAQTAETLTNLRAVLQVARTRTSAAFDLSALNCIVYIRHASQLAAVRAEFEAATGAASIAAKAARYLEADVCRSDLDVEIEAFAFADGVIHP